MELLDEELCKELREEFATLTDDVDLLFHPGPNSEPGDLMGQVLEEMGQLSSRLHIVPVDEPPPVDPRWPHDVEGPILTLGRTGGRVYGVRFLGVTSGLEFGSLVEAVLDAGRGAEPPAPPTQRILDILPRQVHIQVFTTPT